MKHVVLGVTGSIAAYKSAELVSRLRKDGYEVKVILTKSGSKFITPLTLETLSCNPTACDMFVREGSYDVEHIALAKWADVFVVAPATANFIAKYTVGIADDMLTTTVLATHAPVVIAPAMNTAMYEHITMQENMQALKKRGVYFIEPDSGFLACGDVGKGRMEEPVRICEFIKTLLTEKDLCGKRFLITAGATCEDIDPVRFLTNRSTGTMGVSLANAAHMRGAAVTLVAGHINSSAVLSGINMINVRSTHDMYEAVRANAAHSDVIISAAAPADFTPEAKSDAKIKKQGSDGLCLKLKPTEDILKSIADSKGSRIHIGFAAETNNIEENAQKKLRSKCLNAIAANDVSKSDNGFGTGNNAVTLYCEDGSKYDSGTMSKSRLSDWLLDKIRDIWL